MEEDIKGIILEIFLLVLPLFIVIPICVNASSEYNNMREKYFSTDMASVDISSKDDMKEVTVYSNSDKEMVVNLIFQINSNSSSYNIELDGVVYDVSTLSYVDEGEYRYYNLGVYSVIDKRVFRFKLDYLDNNEFDNNITYAFLVEGAL